MWEHFLQWSSRDPGWYLMCVVYPPLIRRWRWKPRKTGAFSAGCCREPRTPWSFLPYCEAEMGTWSRSPVWGCYCSWMSDCVCVWLPLWIEGTSFKPCNERGSCWDIRCEYWESMWATKGWRTVTLGTDWPELGPAQEKTKDIRKPRSQQSIEVVVGDFPEGSGTQEQWGDTSRTLGVRLQPAGVCRY